MEKTQNLHSLAKALTEASRNIRSANLDPGRIRDAASKIQAAIATMDAMVTRPGPTMVTEPDPNMVTELGPTTDGHTDQDVRRLLAPIGVLAEELAENSAKVNAVLKKLGEDLLRAGETLG